MKIPRSVSRGYAWLGRQRRALYQRSVFTTKHLSAPVVSIGNITSGGVGKTPLTLLLCSALADKIRICTLSRGYKAAAEKRAHPTVISEWGALTPKSYDGGDEPSLLASRLPNCSVIAGRNRHACGEKALELGAQLLVLDDGFQHLQLYRNYDIVVVDAVDPWSGLLREPQQSLEKADLIAVTQADQLSTEALEQFHQELASWSAAPVVSFYLDQPQAFNASNEPIPLEGKRVAAACGIGKPQRFVETLERAGAEVVDLLTWRDHEHPNPKALHRFAEAHKNADLLLCTEKDWVRFQSGSLRPPSMGYLRIDLAVFSGTDRWNQALSKIIALVP